MPDGGTALIAGGTNLLTSMMAGNAAESAASTQAAASQAGIAETRRQFDEMQALLSPYVQVGQPALQQQMALLGFAPEMSQMIDSTGQLTGNEQQVALPYNRSDGLFPGLREHIALQIEGQAQPAAEEGNRSGGLFPGLRHFASQIEGQAQPAAEEGIQPVSYVGGDAGAEAQRAAIARIEQSPILQAQMKQGEQAMLQRASATGGLRGGNIQGALAQYRPSMLNQAIQRQYENLAGITSLGQQSAAGVGSAGMQTGANISNLLAQQGAAQAGGILGRSQATQQMLGAIPQGLGMYYGLTGKTLF